MIELNSVVLENTGENMIAQGLWSTISIFREAGIMISLYCTSYLQNFMKRTVCSVETSICKATLRLVMLPPPFGG